MSFQMKKKGGTETEIKLWVAASGILHWMALVYCAAPFKIRAVLNFFWPPANRAGKVAKLPVRIETYQPEKKNERGTFFVVVHMTAFLAGSLRSREYGRSA